MTTRRLPDPIILNNSLKSTTGRITIGQTTYQFPVEDGGAGQVLTTTGANQLLWQTASGGGSSALNPKNVSTNYTAIPVDNFIRYTGAAAGTVTLFSNVSNPGRTFIVENQSTAGAATTVAPAAGDTIDGDSQPVLLDARYDSVYLVSDGLGNWLTV